MEYYTIYRRLILDLYVAPFYDVHRWTFYLTHRMYDFRYRKIFGGRLSYQNEGEMNEL
jgi:hypothetical protein